MTRYLWDTSNHDWPRGPMDLARAHAEGIDGFTAKSSEGNTYLDPNYAAAMARARPVGFAVLGPYHVLWPLNPVSQADDWFAKVETNSPWWREHPCWIWQIDAELFQNFSPYRQPTVGEINACGDRIVALAHCKPTQVTVYAPEWLYGETLGGLRYRNLWASNYVPGSGTFTQLYPGDGSTRWHAYSGITPTILQYTSSATIAGQSPADANAARVETAAALQALFLGGDPPMTAPTPAQIWAYPGIPRWQPDDSIDPGTAVAQNVLAFIDGRVATIFARLGGETSALGNTTIDDAIKQIQATLATQAQTLATLATKAQVTAATQQIMQAIGQVPTADQVADAVVAKLPSTSGGVTKQDVVDAVTQVLTGAYITPKPTP